MNERSNTRGLSYSVHPPAPPFCWGGGGEPPTKFSKRGGLDRTSTFRGDCGERGCDFLQRGCNFHIKKKLKFEIFNKKKFMGKNTFLCHN